MLARSTILKHPNGLELQTPLLVSSFSSKGFRFIKRKNKFESEAIELLKQAAEPDRHLVRISEKFGYGCPETFCNDISRYTGEKTSVVDIVLWRYATLEKKYLDE